MEVFNSVFNFISTKKWSFNFVNPLQDFIFEFEKMPDLIRDSKSDIEKALEETLFEKMQEFNDFKTKPKTLDTSQLGAAQLATAAGGAAKENKVGAIEARFLSGQTGSTENYARKTSENTQRQTTILQQILKATQELKQGNPQTGGMLAANLI
jgi:hypothetical protein